MRGWSYFHTTLYFSQDWTYPMRKSGVKMKIHAVQFFVKKKKKKKGMQLIKAPFLLV
jgi:hypothetical protein